MPTLYALNCGRLQFDRRFFFPDAAPGQLHMVDVPCFLIRQGRNVVLFDTGVDCLAQQDPVARLGQRIASNFKLVGGPQHTLPAQLALLGLGADDVTHVINSHFHFDHCGCNALFARATFIVQQAEMAAARAANSPGNPAPWACWDHPFDYRLVHGEHDVLGDGTLVLLPTPGHTAGHQSLRVRAAPGFEFVLTADACYSRAHLDEEIVPGGTATWHAGQMVDTFGHLRRLQDEQGCHLIFGHDPAQWATLRQAPEAVL